MKLRSNKGFSLVELIIVIAIMGIIAAVAVPNLTGVQKKSQVNADTRTAEEIGKSVRTWLADANVTEARLREKYIIDENRALSDMTTSVVTTKKGLGTGAAASDNAYAQAKAGLESYVAVTYVPSVTNSSGTTMNYWVGLIKDRVVIFVDDTQPSDPTGSTEINIFSLSSDNEVVEGIAYVEGISALTTDNIKTALGL